MIPHLSLPAALTAAECSAAIALAANAPMRTAKLVGQVAADTIRRADIAWLDDLPGGTWIMDRMTALVAEANRTFAFALDECAESAQIARYDAARLGHFDWHSDIGTSPLAARRKLTVVAQLSDPASYEGGQLDLRPDSNIHVADNTVGAVTIFPSFTLHRVTPVTAGTRWSLTLWAHGPAFR